MLVTLVTLVNPVTLVTLVTLITLVTLVTLFWSPIQFYRAQFISPESDHGGLLIQTLPKAQRTRGLSSSYQSNYLRSYQKFKHKS